jgi:hypothetical protein
MPLADFRSKEIGSFNEIGRASHDHVNQKTTKPYLYLVPQRFRAVLALLSFIALLGTRLPFPHCSVREQLDYSQQDKEEASNLHRIYNNPVQ